MRALVHEPMNAFWIAIEDAGWPARRPMYAKARSMSCRRAGSVSRAGSGTA